MRKACLLSLICLAGLRAQVITTIAGTDWLPPASGSQALTASLGGPTGAAIDAAGNVYITDSLENLVERISPQGVLTVIAGNGKAGFSGDGGPAINASLNEPWGVAVDASGNVYVADSLNNRVRMISRGIITTLAGTGTDGYAGDGGLAARAQLSDPTGVAVDRAGNVYIADFHNTVIRMVSGGIISTVVGNGTYGYAGDGGDAKKAELGSPEDVAVDSSGTLYIADTFNHVIRKVAGGVITTIAGTGIAGFYGDNGPAVSAFLNTPRAIALDGQGNIFIVDTVNYRIREISGGVITTVAGDGYGSPLNDNGPATNAAVDVVYGVAVSSSGVLYIPQYYEGVVRKVSGGTISEVAGNGQAGYAGDGSLAVNALLNYPKRVAVDASGNVYVADYFNNRVRKIAGGIVTTVAGTGEAGYSGDGGQATRATLDGPSGLAFDSQGNLYIADNFNQVIRKVSGGIISTVAGNGDYSYSGDGGKAINAALANPTGVTFDGNGNMYISEYSNNVIRKVAPDGTITTVAGNTRAVSLGDGGPATRASLNGPSDVAVDTAGNIYIAEEEGNRIRKVSNGTISTVAGTGIYGYSGDGGSATSAQLRRPNGLTVDAAGNIYIADSESHRIRRVSNGTISAFAGNGAETFGGDGGAPTSASLNLPAGVAIANGNIYIADSANNRIRAILSAGIPLTSSASTLTFSATADGAAPPAQTVTLSTPIAGIAVSATASAPWITISSSSLATPGGLQVSVNPTGLTAGAYGGTVRLSAPLATPSSITLSVRLTVSAPVSPSLGVSAPSLSFTATQGSGATVQSLQVLNTGSGSLSYSVAVSSSASNWLTVSPTSGTATPTNPAALSLTATPGPLTAGTYSGSITVSGNGHSVTVPVTFSVSPASGILLVSQNALTFTAVAQGGAPLPRTVGILNTGQGSFNWTASASTLSGGNWLQISPSSGSVQRPFLDVSTLSATVTPANLTPGVYYGKVQVSSSGAVNTPQSYTVILNVLPAGTNLGPEVYPNGLIFTGVAGATPGSQDISVQNTASAVNNYESSTIGPVSILPTNTAVLPSKALAVHIYPDFSSLVPGVTLGAVSLLFSDGSLKAVPVLMSVAPSGSTASVYDPASGEFKPRASCSGPLKAVLRRPEAAFSATVGQSVTIEASVSDSCGNIVAPGGSGPQPQVNALFSNGDPNLAMVHIGNGVWQGSWRPVNTASPVVATVTALAGSGSGVNLVGGQASVTGAVVTPSATAGTPLVTAQGVVHAASDAASPIAPGELITIYGANLATGAPSNATLPLPTSSQGTQVLLGSQALPILYTSSGQMNVQVPYSAPVNTTYQLSVQNGSTLSVPQTLTVAQASPGIFTINQAGSGQGAIMKSDGVTLAQPGTPASIGETVVIYCTGLGATNPAASEGQAAPGGDGLAHTAADTTVMIGGQPAHVQFSGLSPGYAGLYQVNAVVPGGIQTGDAVPVTISVSGQSSQPGVTLAVH